MNEKRFTYSNGRIYDHESKGDTKLSYNLNDDGERKKLVEFMNAREGMIHDVNKENDITLSKIIEKDRKIGEMIIQNRKKNAMIRLLKEIIESYAELCKVINDI